MNVRTRASLGLLIAGGLGGVTLWGADPWVRTVGNGFGDANNIQIAEFHVFKGQLYAGGSRNPATGPAQLWRSSDGASWTQVTSFSPPFPTNQVASIISFGDSGGASPQFIYLGTNNASGSGSIYRSSDGASWTQINGAGSGWVSAGNGFISPHLVTKGGFLYAGTANTAGAQVWRRPVDDSGSWTEVLDFAAIDRTLTAITYLYVFNDVIYAGTGLFGGSQPTGGFARLYSSTTGDAGTWAKHAGVGDGFGNTNNLALTSIADFNGALYAATRNLLTGGELYRSTDTVTWTRVAANGLGSSRNIELHNLRVAQNQLWIATLARSPGLFQVWRSTDGTGFTQSNVDGFGDANNTSLGGSTVGITIGFGTSIFWGGTNEVTGAQVWRLDSIPAESPSAPGAPGSLAASSAGSTVTLTWSAPTTGGAVASYLLEAGSASGLSDLASFSTGTTATSFSAGGVDAGTYFVRVRASNAAGIGAASNEVALTVGGSAPCTAPAAPTGLTASTGRSTATLIWNSSAGATSYVLEAGSAPGLMNLANFDTGTGATSFTATGVARGIYHVRVRAKNACGVSAASSDAIVPVQ